MSAQPIKQAEFSSEIVKKSSNASTGGYDKYADNDTTGGGDGYDAYEESIPIKNTITQQSKFSGPPKRMNNPTMTGQDQQHSMNVKMSTRPPFQNNVERDDFLEEMDKNYDKTKKATVVTSGNSKYRTRNDQSSVQDKGNNSGYPRYDSSGYDYDESNNQHGGGQSNSGYPVSNSNLMDGAYADDYTAVATDQCELCGRSFSSAALAKHAKICEKVFLQKRKRFDSSSHRHIEDENKPFNAKPIKGQKSGRGQKSNAPQKSKQNQSNDSENSIPKWKLQSLQFRAAMKAAGGGELSAQDEHVMQAANQLVPCPHCSRKFNEKAAERHIPVCNSIKAKPTMLVRSSNSSGGFNSNQSLTPSSRMSSQNKARDGSNHGSAAAPTYKIGNSNKTSW